ncbi:MAG: restriction endonuclease subunit S [Clostridia bacterium]|nr:restriction endonuclease subunit S [Clostridia bacterium]
MTCRLNILTAKPCLTVARSGAAGFISYQGYGCVVGDSAKLLLLKNENIANKYVYLFLKTILMANKFKYTYGRKVTEDKYSKEIMLLPSKQHGENGQFSPDWQYMENYIKALPYGDRI